MSRRRCTLARQVSLIPALLLIDTDDDSGRTTVYPLPLDRHWRLGLTWLALIVPAWLADLWRELLAVPLRAANEVTELAGGVWRRWVIAARRYLTRNRWGMRLSLELQMTLILGRQFGLAALGR
jgi:hypothetical protein